MMCYYLNVHFQGQSVKHYTYLTYVLLTRLLKSKSAHTEIKE